MNAGDSSPAFDWAAGSHLCDPAGINIIAYVGGCVKWGGDST